MSLLDKARLALKRWPTHPIDTQYGIETSAQAPWLALPAGSKEARRANMGYAGSQPSIIRAAIQTLPDVTGSHFIDLGCGKGRVLAVATEFPFATISGIELSPTLARIARSNMATMARRFPDRQAVKIITGDATSPALPVEGTAVLFVYNSFKADLFARLLMAIWQRSPQLKVWLISYNPTQAPLIDADRGLERYYAAKLDVSTEEQGASAFGNTKDSVVIWQSKGLDMTPARPEASRRVRVTTPNIMAHVDHS